MLKLSGIEYDIRKLIKAEMEDNSRITEVIGIQQRIHLQNCVIESWKIKEDLEGICSVSFKFHYAKKKHNLLHNYSHYEVIRNAEGTPILIRSWT